MKKTMCPVCKTIYYDHGEKVAIAANGGMCKNCRIEELKSLVKAREKELKKLKERIKDLCFDL